MSLGPICQICCTIHNLDAFSATLVEVGQRLHRNRMPIQLGLHFLVVIVMLSGGVGLVHVRKHGYARVVIVRLLELIYAREIRSPLDEVILDDQNVAVLRLMLSWSHLLVTLRVNTEILLILLRILVNVLLVRVEVRPVLIQIAIRAPPPLRARVLVILIVTSAPLE